jgi:hypothetical protein
MKELAKHTIGIDFGRTIFDPNNGNKIVFPDAFRVIRRMVDEGHTVHIISKVTEEQEARGRKWIVDVKFLEETGLTMDRIHFCRERSDKAVIAERVGLTHHIDDRPEVMAHMDIRILKYLFQPKGDDLVEYFNRLRFHTVTVVNTWLEIESLIFK